MKATELTQFPFSSPRSARVYEEEDFQPGLYNFNLCNELSDQKVVATLKESETDIQRRLREMEATSEAFEDLTAVFNRIKFQRVMLQCLLLLFPSKTLSPNELEMSEIAKLLTTAAELMPAIKRTVSRGTQPDPDSKLVEPRAKKFSLKFNFQTTRRT